MTILGFRYTEQALHWDLDISTHNIHGKHTMIQYTMHLATQVNSTAVFAHRAMYCREQPAHS
jgi:hypothetical protein